MIETTTPKRRKTRDQLQARAKATARYRAKLKAEGLPTAAQIDAAIAGLTIRFLTTAPERLLITSEAFPLLVAKIVMWGRWEHLGEAGVRAVEAHIEKLKKKRRPKARSPVPPVASATDVEKATEAAAPSASLPIGERVAEFQTAP